MTYLELKQKLNEMSDDQLTGQMEVIIGPGETMLVELAIGVSSDGMFLVESFEWNNRE